MKGYTQMSHNKKDIHNINGDDNNKFEYGRFSGAFDREGSTLGVMDDLQIAVHTYDGCERACSGCLVDKHFRNNMRGQCIIKTKDLELIQSRVLEYYKWVQENLNTKTSGYFGTHEGGYQVNHHSYTMRFGNHSELPIETLVEIAESLRAEYRVFSTAPTENITRFIELKNRVKGEFYLEIIYDPIHDDPIDLRNMILEMRENDILGYPEVLVTRRLLDAFDAEKFVAEAVAPLGNISTQMQFGRFTPARTRGFKKGQIVPVDEEVEWLTKVAEGIIERGLDIHPIPIGEYAVTFHDEYGELDALGNDGSLNYDRLPDPEPFNIENIREKTRDIFLTSLYIDHNLDVNVWSESMGQHVLDRNFGYEPIGNLREKSIAEMVNEENGVIEKMLNEVIRNLITHPKCAPCRYKSFCASHAVPLFRRWHDDNGKHCYGYLPVIRAFQSDIPFLRNMVDGFKDLGF